MRNLDGITNAYAAGLFDGEGHVGVSMHKRGDINAVVQVSMCSYETLARLQQFWGGSLKNYGPSTKGYRTDYWRWVLSGRDNIRDFLLDVRPFLLAKAPQADLVLSFLASTTPYQRGVEERALRLGFYLALKESRCAVA